MFILTLLTWLNYVLGIAFGLLCLSKKFDISFSFKSFISIFIIIISTRIILCNRLYWRARPVRKKAASLGDPRGPGHPHRAPALRKPRPQARSHPGYRRAHLVLLAAPPVPVHQADQPRGRGCGGHDRCEPLWVVLRDDQPELLHIRGGHLHIHRVRVARPCVPRDLPLDNRTSSVW